MVNDPNYQETRIDPTYVANQLTAIETLVRDIKNGVDPDTAINRLGQIIGFSIGPQPSGPGGFAAFISDLLDQINQYAVGAGDYADRLMRSGNTEDARAAREIYREIGLLSRLGDRAVKDAQDLAEVLPSVKQAADIAEAKAKIAADKAAADAAAAKGAEAGAGEGGGVPAPEEPPAPKLPPPTPVIGTYKGEPVYDGVKYSNGEIIGADGLPATTGYTFHVTSDGGIQLWNVANDPTRPNVPMPTIDITLDALKGDPNILDGFSGDVASALNAIKTNLMLQDTARALLNSGYKGPLNQIAANEDGNLKFPKGSFDLVKGPDDKLHLIEGTDDQGKPILSKQAFDSEDDPRVSQAALSMGILPEGLVDQQYVNEQGRNLAQGQGLAFDPTQDVGIKLVGSGGTGNVQYNVPSTDPNISTSFAWGAGSGVVNTVSQEAQGQAAKSSAGTGAGGSSAGGGSSGSSLPTIPTSGDFATDRQTLVDTLHMMGINSPDIARVSHTIIGAYDALGGTLPKDFDLNSFVFGRIGDALSSFGRRSIMTVSRPRHIVA